jgi:hypothetical protein
MPALHDINTVSAIVEGLLKIKSDLDSHAKKTEDLAKMRNLSIHYWSLITTIDDCIHSVANLHRAANTACDTQYAIVINGAGSSESERRRKADNDTEYLALKDEASRLKLYLDYLNNLRSDVFAGHYIMKSTYEHGVVLYQMTPKTES